MDLTRQLTTVVVSDDEDTCDALEAIVSADARFAAHPRLAPGTTPDVVLIDVGDPHLQGLNLLGQLRRAMPATRFVAFSSIPDPITLLAAVDHGADSYVGTDSLDRELLPTLEALCFADDLVDAATDAPSAMDAGAAVAV